MECSICTESIDLSSNHILECGHAFHADCIITWFRHGNSCCPNCRNPGETKMLNFNDSQARASELRKRSRNKNAPKRLKILVERLKFSEQKYKEVRKLMKEYRLQNIRVFNEWCKLRSKLTHASNQIIRKTRILGTFSSPDFPLPNIEYIDSDDFD